MRAHEAARVKAEPKQKAKGKAVAPATLAEAGGRSPRDPSSPNGGGSVASSVSQSASGQAQQKASPQRPRRSLPQDEDSSALLVPSVPPAPGGTCTGGGGASGSNSPAPSASQTVAATSPRGEAKDTKPHRAVESRLSASTKAQVREVEARLPSHAKSSAPRLQTTAAGAKASPPGTGVGGARRGPPPGLESTYGPPPGLARPPPGLEVPEFVPPAYVVSGVSTSEVSGETDSFDEEVELLRCQADLVEAAAELGTTSADDDFLYTDPDMDDDEDGIGALAFRVSRGWQAPGAESVVIEEDEEGMTDDGFEDDDHGGFEVDGSEMRSRLWAQSLLRLKRSIDEIYSLCEYESDEIMCEQVQKILMNSSQDFVSLVKRFETQQEYALLPGDIDLKKGVAWTTRTPKATKGGESALEILERSHSPSSTTSFRSSKELGRSSKGDMLKRRASSLDPQPSRVARDDRPQDAEEPRTGIGAASGGGTGEAVGGEADDNRVNMLETSREDHLHSMVQSALQRIESRLGRPSRRSPEELSKRNEDRQLRARQLRAEQEEQRLDQLRQIERRVCAARERRHKREQHMQGELLDKMTRARRQYQDQLRLICERARNENRKTAEVAYISKEVLKSEKEMMKQKQENARLARALLREQMRKRLMKGANRIAQVSENRKRQQEIWKHKVSQELEEKDRLASQRRKQHIHSIRVKSQEQETLRDSVREKRREIQEEDERSVQQQQQDFNQLRNQSICRLALSVDGLPDGVREEVAEQLRASVPQPASSRRSRVAHGKAASNARCCTPPSRGRAQSESLKSSPKSDVLGTEMSDIEEDVAPQVASQSEAMQRSKARKGRAKPRPAAKNVPAARHAEQFLSERTATRGSLADSTDARVVDAGSGEGAGLAPGENANPAADREVSLPVSSDEGEEEPCSDQEGSDAGDPVALSEALVCEGEIPDLPGESDLPESPTPINCDSVKTPRPKAKPDAKESRRWRSSSPPDATSGQGDVEHQIIGAAPDGQSAKYLEALRKQLSTEAFSDEEALKLATQGDGSRSAAPNAAHRARISKLATDLGRVIPLLGNTLGNACSAVAEDSSGQQLGAHSLDLERADAVLSEFCKVLDQSQREADYVLVLQLGCVGKVMDICSRIKDSMGTSGAIERNMPPAMKQLSSVMLSALKWLGLVSKQKISRVFLLLTNRVVLLADVAVACLATPPLLETNSMASLFLPQVLHVLSLHVKQTLPDASSCFRQKLICYLLVCGLSDKLRDVFTGAGLRGMRLFDGASPVPLTLLRAMCFLGTLVNAYRLPEGVAEPNSAASTEEPSPAPVLQVLRRTDLFGIVSVLGTILFADKGKAQGAQPVRLPQTVVSLAVQALRILNHVARIHLGTLQEVLGACQQELYHLLVSLLDYCMLHGASKPGQGQGQDENELLHESLALLGHYCLQRKEHQGLMCYGEGQTLLAKIASLPLDYFMDERLKLFLFPTLLATCFESEQNLELLRNEMNLMLITSFLVALLAQKDDARLPEAATNGFGGRFPSALWSRALEFFEGGLSTQGTDTHV